MDIVEELRHDREAGAKRLETEYKTGLMALALRFCNDPGDAEELVNSTFAEVVENVDDFLEQSSLFTWMCKILTSKFARTVRRKSNQMEVYPGVLPDVVDEDAQESIYANLDASLLRDAIDTLPPDIRKTLTMHYFMDFSVKDVARMLAVPAGTVKWRLHYARKILAAKLGAAAKKPGGKALLLALALCGLAALGAAVWNLGWGEPSRRADAPAWAYGEGTDGTGGTGGTGLQPFNFSSEQSTEQPQQETSSMTIRTRSAALGAASALALASAPSAASGDEYQFIVSGDTAAAATAGVVEAESTAGPLDVRHHAVAESRAMALSSIKNGSFVIVVR